MCTAMMLVALLPMTIFGSPAAASTPFLGPAIRIAVRDATTTGQQKIKNEASSRRLLCMLSEGVCPVRPKPHFLATKPCYPPRRPRAMYAQGKSDADSLPCPAPDVAQVLPCGPACPCDEEKMQQLLKEQRVLWRTVTRLESVLSETLSALKSTDDLAFLERQTCSIIVYNENLTIKRQLRLLRAEIMRISTKYSM